MTKLHSMGDVDFTDLLGVNIEYEEAVVEPSVVRARDQENL